MTVVVAFQLAERRQDILQPPKQKDTLSCGKPIPATRILMQYRPPRGQITGSPVTEPSASRCYIGMFGDAEVGT